ncbi:MAG: S49 family peptidase [Methylococcaceae bacterium]|nr:S49 family peptidase [Methylococcaceae bacterium]
MMSEENTSATNWERQTLEKLLLAAVDEQRKARLWGIFFKGALLIYLAVALWLVAKPVSGLMNHSDSKGHTGVIDVSGNIMEGKPSDADNLILGLRDAIKDRGTKGIILRMNSPGGTPVQAAYVFEEIRRIKREKPDLPIYAVVSDLCASGCYYIASAADKIYVSPASMVGSIGVIMNGFGFVDIMQRFGVERRLMTAGEHKALLDPFSPVNPEEKEHIQGVIDHVHHQFIDAVKQGRGDRLKGGSKLFSGLVWSGDEAITLGLADELGDTRSVAKKVIRAEDLVNFTRQEKLLDRITHSLGTSLAAALQSGLGLSAQVH